MIQILEKAIPLADLVSIAQGLFGDFVKAVVDVEREVIAIGGELHADEEAILLENGSKQQHLWGINIYPAKPQKEWIEYDSMINIRPSQNNRSRGIEDLTVQKKIRQIVEKTIQ